MCSIARGGGMELSTGFRVKFDFDDPNGVKQELEGQLKYNEGYNYAEQYVDEVNLPGAQAATGQLTGRFTGEGVTNYIHQKMFTDFQLGWMCDANMSPFKFMQTWYQYIFQEYDTSAQEIPSMETAVNASTENMLSTKPKEYNRTTRLRFPENYHCTIRIAKAEKGPASDTSRVSTVHILQEAFPYGVEEIPLSF